VLDNTQISRIYTAEVTDNFCERGSYTAKTIGNMENEGVI
jgi:hypothetical protein